MSGYGLSDDPQFGLHQRGPEDEEERDLRRMRGDESEVEVEDEAEAEAEMLELFETAATALGQVVRAMRRRKASEIAD